MEKEYYVYIYLDPRKSGKYQYGEYCFDYEPFYVGKGSGDRLMFHLFESELNNYNRNRLKNNKIKKIKRELNINPIIIKYKEKLTEQDALDLEKTMINKIGRIDLNTGPLTNLTDGGDNPPSWKGRHHSEETKRKISENQIGEKHYNFGKHIPEETKRKMSISHLGKNRYIKTEEHRRKIAETIIKNGSSRGKNNGRYGYHMTDEEKKRHSEKMKGKLSGDKHPRYGKSKYIYYINDPIRKIIFDPCLNLIMLKKLCKEENLNYKSILIRLRENKDKYKGFSISKKLKENDDEKSIIA